MKWLKRAMKKGKQDIGLTSDGIIFHRVYAGFHVDLYTLINIRKKHYSSFPSSHVMTNKTNISPKSCGETFGYRLTGLQRFARSPTVHSISPLCIPSSLNSPICILQHSHENISNA